GVKVTIEGPLPNIHADPVALLQLFQNIISNGIKFSRKDCSPEIGILLEQRSFKADEYDLQITIEDNGVGISRKNLKRIFSPLVRLHSNDDVEGSGLGLAIAKKIIEQHQGHMWIDSKEGQGSKVNVLLRSSQC